jgi:pyrroloquinoline-quinone synthase
MNASAFIDHLKAIINEKHLLTHPFYQMWTKGTLPKEVMERYAEQYYHLEKNFPNFLSQMLMTAEDAKSRAVILENFNDEAGDNHRKLWIQFGQGIGTTKEAMQNSEMIAETKAAVDTFNTLSTANFLLGSGALAAYESQIPEVAKEKIAGLVANYGIKSEETMAFFRVHGEVDVAHTEAWWDIISDHATDTETQAQVEDAVIQGRDALWNFLSGIMREYMPEVDCECEMATA